MAPTRQRPDGPTGVPADHLPKGGGVTSDDPARTLAQEKGTMLAQAHGPVTGTHTHRHSAYKKQGEDATHEHLHRHDGDSLHSHDHGMKVPGKKSLQSSAFMRSPHPVGLNSFISAATHEHGSVWQGLTLTASGDVETPMAMLGASWGVAQLDAKWYVVTAAGVPWEQQQPLPSYREALQVISEQLAAQGEDRPILAESWRSDMAYEGVSTGDGRRIAPGAIEYRDCPLPLMLQTTTDMGHFGAVLAGAIEQTGKVGTTAVGTGSFDDSQAGRQFTDIINARGKFGVSIDVAEAEGELICTETDPEYGDCIDGEVLFSMIRIMGLTGTPFPAFENAYIEIAAQPQQEQVAASATGSDGQEAPCEDCLGELVSANSPPAGNLSDPPATIAPTSMNITVTAAATSSVQAPPVDWFEDPGFAVGDGRLVRQPNGRYACPLTIDLTADGGRIYGHLASWFSCHTAYQDSCVTPPRSQTGYAAFMDGPSAWGPMSRPDGSPLLVGQLSMGCGHASEDPRTAYAQVKAHYDGGPGAVQLADVRVGEDDFGIWIAGALRPEVTPDQAMSAASMSVSGDWRKVWQGKGIDLVAILAGVTSPGFAITRALTAAGFRQEIDDVDVLPTMPKMKVVDGEVATLIAAGVVRRPWPWETSIAAVQSEVEELRGDMTQAKRTLSHYRRELVQASAALRDATLELAEAERKRQAEADPIQSALVRRAMVRNSRP